MVKYIYSYVLTDRNNSLATSMDIERIFSKGCLLLSHVCNRLSAQSTHAILCLGSWSLLNLVKDDDVMVMALLPEVDGEGSDYEMEDGWDAIATQVNLL